MPSIINSDDGVVSGTSGLKTTGGNDGILSIQNNGTTNVTVTAAGNTGFGTASPASKVQVAGTFYANDTINLYGSATNLRGINFGSNEIAWAQGTTSCFLNLSNATGNSGASYNFTIRGLNSNGGAGATLSYVTLDATSLYFTGSGGASQMFPCRAWVNFNGTGTVAIRASGNVSSITDNGTGDYTVNFTNAMPDANYSSVFTSKWTTGQPSNFCGSDSNGITSSSCRAIAIGNVSDAPLDSPFVNVAIFR